MKYDKIWEKVLSNGERVEYEFSIGDRFIKYGLIMYGIICVLLAFLGGFGIFLFLFILCAFMYMKKANAYALTNKRVLIHRGLLSTKTISVDYHKITDVLVSEPFMDRILTHSGHIAIDTAGTGGEEIVLKHVEKPYEIKKKLDELKDKVYGKN